MDKRTFDVGIAEQHAGTFAAGMVVEGLKPFLSINFTLCRERMIRSPLPLSLTP